VSFRLIESKAALTYPEEIRAEAIRISGYYSLIHPLGVFLMLVAIVSTATLCEFLENYLPGVVTAALCLAGGILMTQIINPFFIGQRVLMTKRDEILRIIQGGFNGRDKDRKVP
jgi:hypothetical protein